MARIAILSDPHGDLVALEAVIADLETVEPVDEVLIGGDIAQGGPQPAEVVDLIRERNWPAVLGNSDELLVRTSDGRMESGLPSQVAERARWSVGRLGAERLDYLRSLPLSLQRGPALLVHATPWSTEDVVLPDAGEATAERMIREAGARVVMYGHIHTAYQRRIGDSVLLSVGAINGSNDSDPRSAYTIVTFDDSVTAEVRRVEFSLSARIAAYEAAGLEAPRNLAQPGDFPVRSRPGVRVVLWP
jgi:predicted phosphodiesterase